METLSEEERKIFEKSLKTDALIALNIIGSIVTSFNPEGIMNTYLNSTYFQLDAIVENLKRLLEGPPQNSSLETFESQGRVTTDSILSINDKLIKEYKSAPESSIFKKQPQHSQSGVFSYFGSGESW